MDTTLVGRDTGRELIEMLSLCRTAARYCSTSPAERPIRIDFPIDWAGRNRLHGSMVRKGWSRIASLFVGPGGLRAGWRFLLFALGIELAEFYLRTPLLSLLARPPLSLVYWELR